METVLLEKYQALPDDLRKEVIDFIEFLAGKYHKSRAESAPLAQKRAALFGNAKGMITIMPDFGKIPEGFDGYY